MAGLTLKHVTKRFEGGVVAVSDFNLDIEDKEFIILVGPSGCGKSTTLRMIAGLEEISDGEIYIGDRLVNDVSPKDRDIAMVFQSYALYPHMTIFDNMAFSLKLKKVPKAEIKKRVLEAAKILGIEHLLERKPKALSGGQRQRVALGRAIVREPKVFLMDEPLSNLDAKLRVQMRTEISKLHTRPDRSYDDGNKNSRYERRRHSAGRFSSESLQYSLQPVCCRIYGQPADEPHRFFTGEKRRRLLCYFLFLFG